VTNVSDKVTRGEIFAYLFAKGSEFDLEIYVSGFASSLRPPEAATRSQKAFYRLARGEHVFYSIENY